VINPEITIPPEIIREQVERICSSNELRAKHLLCRLLRFLVEETLAGREEKLKGYTIGVELFKREGDFDPVQDPMVRIHAGRLRRMLKLYYLEAGRNDPVKIEIPKGKYIPVFLSNTFTADRQGTDQRLLRKQPFEPTVAILPFKNLTGNPEKDYFALGFSEELSVELTKFEDLIVYNGIPSSDSGDPNQEIMQHFSASGIRFIIEGSVQLDETRVKVLVKLSDTIERQQIWAERYTRELSLTNLVEIQENITQEIAGELGSEYGIILQQLTADARRIKPGILDTYDAILKFYYYEAHHTSEAAMQAKMALEEAIRKEPDSGMAIAMLAALHAQRYQLDLPGAEESYPKMAELADKALQLDPNSLIVRIVYIYKYFVINDEERFFRETENCLSLCPKSPVRLGAIGFYLSLYGDWERGKDILDKVMHGNLRFPRFFYGATTLYHYRLKRFIEALEEANQYDVPALFWGPMLRAAVLSQLNRGEAARAQIDHLKQLKPDFEKKARYLISRYVKEEDLVEQVVEGLRKAGLQMT
jgi:TolB-like protein